MQQPTPTTTGGIRVGAWRHGVVRGLARGFAAMGLAAAAALAAAQAPRLTTEDALRGSTVPAAIETFWTTRGEPNRRRGGDC